MATAVRRNRRQGYKTLLEAFMTDYNASVANGKDKLIGVFRARPPSFNPPLAYVGTFRETVSHTMGVRQRMSRDELVIVQGVYDNFETVDRQDLVVDAFTDWLTTHYDAAGDNTVTEEVAKEDVELDFKGIVYFATVFSVTSDAAEGRN